MLQIKSKPQHNLSGEQIASLESTLQKVSTDRDQLRKQLTEIQTKLEFENRKLKSELETIQGAAQGKESEIAKLKTENEEMNKKLNWIRKTKADADAEIKKTDEPGKFIKRKNCKNKMIYIILGITGLLIIVALFTYYPDGITIYRRKSSLRRQNVAAHMLFVKRFEKSRPSY